MLDDFSKLRVHIEQVAARHNMSIFQVMQRVSENNPVPVSIFCRKLSPLESIVKFLREEFGYSFTRIASLLNRSPKTIWQAGQNASKKHPEHFSPSYYYLIPLALFSNRKMSILSVAITYLHEEYRLSFAKTAELIERDPRTVWTTYNKYKKRKIKKGNNKRK